MSCCDVVADANDSCTLLPKLPSGNDAPGCAHRTARSRPVSAGTRLRTHQRVDELVAHEESRGVVLRRLRLRGLSAGTARARVPHLVDAENGEADQEGDVANKLHELPLPNLPRRAARRPRARMAGRVARQPHVRIRRTGT